MSPYGSFIAIRQTFTEVDKITWLNVLLYSDFNFEVGQSPHLKNYLKEMHGLQFASAGLSTIRFGTRMDAFFKNVPIEVVSKTWR